MDASLEIHSQAITLMMGVVFPLNKMKGAHIQLFQLCFVIQGSHKAMTESLDFYGYLNCGPEFASVSNKMRFKKNKKKKTLFTGRMDVLHVWRCKSNAPISLKF